jgi:predicted RNase H-like HicB family nuclease
VIVSQTKKVTAGYLQKPFARVLIPDHETGTFTAFIQEFPGCVTQGNTREQALQRLERTAQAWLESALDQGHQIPAPAAEEQYGGKVALRIPRSLHRRAAEAAEREGVSLNHFIATAVAERVGVATLVDRLAAELQATFVDRLAAQLRTTLVSAVTFPVRTYPEMSPTITGRIEVNATTFSRSREDN